MKKKKLENVVKNIAKGGVSKTKDVFEKSKKKMLKTLDQNNDNKFNKEDIEKIKNKINDTAKKTATSIKASNDLRKRNSDIKKLRPIMLEDLNDSEFHMSKLICLTNIDKKYLDSDACKGSIGYMTDCKGLDVVNIFREKIDSFGIEFFPDCESDVYYVNPADKNKYIALENYFSYLKTERVNELKLIAKDLGAKHFKVVFKEEKLSFSKKESKLNTKGNYNIAKAEVETHHNHEKIDASQIEIVSELTLSPHEPKKPKVIFMKNESCIQTLISMRMENAISSEKYSLRLSNTCGIKEKDAEKIDLALKIMKISGNSTLVNEVKNESRRYFEYEIEF